MPRNINWTCDVCGAIHHAEDSLGLTPSGLTAYIFSDAEFFLCRHTCAINIDKKLISAMQQFIKEQKVGNGN